jgi:hypothetical protein
MSTTRQDGKPKYDPHKASEAETMPVVSGPLVDHPIDVMQAEDLRRRAKLARSSAKASGFVAQVLSGGESRGLKGGQDTLGRAKSTYLRSKYSGLDDRRPAPGRISITDA